MTIETLLMAGFESVKEYLALHVLLCLIPAFFLAGAIASLFSRESVLRYFGADASKYISYSVASVSGVLLAVCSCTVLPLFAGIYKRGAGIGPATTFLFSAPAINLLAIVYTAKILGFEIDAARAVAAVSMSIVIGLVMAMIFKSEDKARVRAVTSALENEINPAHQAGLFVLLLAILVLAGMIIQIIPSDLVVQFVGGNSVQSNFIASVAGALMYFATLTEVPIIDSLMKLGMGTGPVLAMLLAGPALSLPNMIVINRVLGFNKAMTYIILTVITATVAGFVAGNIIWR